MSTILFANNASSTLAAPISNVATTANLAAGTGVSFPSPSGGQYFVMTFTDAATQLINEIVHVTARSGDTLTIVRNQEGTVAPSGGWNAGDLAANLWTAGQAGAMLQAGAGALPNLAVYAIVGGVQQVSLNGAAFTTVNATIFTWPASGTAEVTCTASGASGGSTGTAPNYAAGGGGAGDTEILLITGQVAGTNTTVTVGVGATAAVAGSGSTGNNGNNGHASTFGSFITANGGQFGAGALSTPAAGGLGGNGTGGTISCNGGVGGDGFGIGGNGGNSIYGGAGTARTTAVAALNGQAPGAGGGGAYYSANLASGSGADGIIVVRF